MDLTGAAVKKHGGLERENLRQLARELFGDWLHGSISKMARLKV